MTILGLSRFIREAVVPLVGTYLLFLTMVVAYVRRGGNAAEATPRPIGWRETVSYLLRTAAAGYTVFLVIVAVFYLGLGGRNVRLLRAAAVEGGILAFLVVVPVFVLATLVHRRPAEPSSSS